MTDSEAFWHAMNTDWRVAVLFYGILCLSVIYIDTRSTIFRWVIALVFSAALVAVVVSGGGLLLEGTGFIHDWTYTRFVWQATAPMWILLAIICIVGIATPFARKPIVNSKRRRS